MGEDVFRTRAGESELSGKLKVGRASLGEEVEGLEGWQIIINAAGVCRVAQAGRQAQALGHLGTRSLAVGGEGLSQGLSGLSWLVAREFGRLAVESAAGRRAHGLPAGAGGQFCEDTLPCTDALPQNRRLFWACARLTPQLSIRVTGFARAAIRLTTPASEGTSPEQSQA